MKKTFYTLVLSIVAIAAIAWACSFKFSGLAWFPGFMVAVLLGLKIVEVNGVAKQGR